MPAKSFWGIQKDCSCFQVKENVAAGIAGGLFGLILAAAIASWQVIVVVAIIYAVGLFANLATGLR